MWELEEEEAKYIRENECINKQIPHRTNEEWKKDNKDKITEYQKEYKKEYNKDNKVKINEIKKKYYEKNKDKLNEYHKEKITCECGAIITRGNFARHKKTQTHMKFTQCIIID